MAIFVIILSKCFRLTWLPTFVILCNQILFVRTDRRTDGFAIAYSALSMLSRAKNRQKLQRIHGHIKLYGSLTIVFVNKKAVMTEVWRSKNTAWCALYTGALKIFGTPIFGYLPKFFMDKQNLKSLPLSVPEIIGVAKKIRAVPVYAHTFESQTIL